MKYIILLASLCLFASASSAQSKKKSKKIAVPEIEELPAEFVGGDDGLSTYLDSTVRYPSSELKSKKTGYVSVVATIGPTGNVSGAKVSSSALPSSFGAEAVRAVSSMPNWQPASRKGKPVRSTVSVDIYFNPEVARRKALLKKENQQNGLDDNTTTSAPATAKPTAVKPTVAAKPNNTPPPTYNPGAASGSSQTTAVATGLGSSASFPGGPSKLATYLADNLIYPPQELEYGFNGHVVVHRR
jgi:TonB family protein